MPLPFANITIWVRLWTRVCQCYSSPWCVMVHSSPHRSWCMTSKPLCWSQFWKHPSQDSPSMKILHSFTALMSSQQVYTALISACMQESHGPWRHDRHCWLRWCNFIPDQAFNKLPVFGGVQMRFSLVKSSVTITKECGSAPNTVNVQYMCCASWTLACSVM